MYSVMVGLSPQTGQFGSRRSFIVWNSSASASYSSSRPTSGSPTPSASFNASVAWIEPITPGSTPSPPPSAQLGPRSGGGDDRNVWPHGSVVHEVPRREVVRAVHDHVPAGLEDPIDVLRGQPLAERDDLDVRVQRLERPPRRVDLRLAEPVRRMHDLALQ